MSCEVNSQFRTSYTVTNADDEYITPTTITLAITKPDGTAVNPAPTPIADSVGNYHYDYTFLAEGLHTFSWATTGPVTHRTDYQNANVWRSIIGITEAKDFINDSLAPVSTLRMIMASATELAEGIVGTCVQRTFTDERIPGYTRNVLRMPHGPLPNLTAITSITSLWTGGPSWVTADLIIYPDSATCEPLDMLGFWLGPWKATYTAGRQVIPYRIQLAVKEIIMDLWAIHRPYGADELEPGPEETARYETMLAQYQIPPHARQMLESEALPGFGA